jgi:hypothetical protein
MKLELSSEEVKTIVEILKYSIDSCPVESISDKVDISIAKLQDLILKLEATLASQ